MELIFNSIIVLYLLSTANYMAYLFFQKERMYQNAFSMLIFGFVAQTLMIFADVIKTGHLPVNNLHEILFLVGWTVAVAFLFFQYRYTLKILGVFAAPLMTILVAISSQIPDSSEPVRSIFNNFWLTFHVMVIFIGEAAFALGCGIGILYLLQEHAIKTKNRGFFFKRLPSLELLDTAGYGCIVVGFTLLTVGLISGFLYAKIVWGRFWSWDPKEVWSGITWLFYAALLHERLTVGWRGRKAALMSIIGFGVVLFTFLGVNFLLKGHHGEFTRW